MTIIKRDEREVSLFRNGRSQAVRIPKEFELDADKAVMWKDPDGTIHIKPKRKRRTPAELVDWLRAQPPLEEDFPEIEELPLEDVDLGLEP
ncbi:antitoxin [Chthonobacter rhizosphaerae]|uniref:antitoxin n=1 Tax=Chthonobacter rhizosphaerae TaxID=2735553 RepID=UPI0015EF4BB2|nr:AbrB/MazE/SpoVT family DNA-binding domain-containing protein [Chthonobacter rhizosphaerae]